MSTVQTSPLTRTAVGVRSTAPARRRVAARLRQQARLYAALALLLLPTLLAVLLINYYPNYSAIKYSRYEWDNVRIEQYVGWKNFSDIFLRDARFWASFQLIGILLAANVVKMWPSIFTAIVLHRLKSERSQYFYRVLFVIPMVIPGLVWVLIWKNVYDPTVGVLNKFLNATGLMGVLDWLDATMPRVAAGLMPVRRFAFDALFGNPWGLILFGAAVLLALPGLRSIPRRWVGWVLLAVAALWAWWDVPWATWLASATARPAGWEPVNGLLRFPVVIGAALVVAGLGRDREETGAEEASHGFARWIGVAAVALGVALVLLTMIWTRPTEQFRYGQPGWLGHSRLIIPSIIFWGFPWVGTVGVLIYLSGLQNISSDVYEAAEIDGVGTWGKLFRIELPLIMTQVRINLIFITIGTLTDYGLLLLLLGPEGGPGNVGMTPGLYMYRAAFIDSRYGYACALGMVMFVLILLITLMYQRYVRVEK